MLPRLPLASYVDSAIDVLVEHFSGVTRAGSDIMLSLLDRFEEALLLPPPWLFILLLTALAWRVTRRPGLPVFVVLGFFLLWNLGLWTPTISTLVAQVAQAARPGDHIVCMSNGGFGGIHAQLLQTLQK